MGRSSAARSARAPRSRVEVTATGPENALERVKHDIRTHVLPKRRPPEPKPVLQIGFPLDRQGRINTQARPGMVFDPRFSIDAQTKPFRKTALPRYGRQVLVYSCRHRGCMWTGRAISPDHAERKHAGRERFTSAWVSVAR